MIDSALPSESALRYINSFEHKYGEELLHLAFHAALPVVINADLVHLLRINFFLDRSKSLPYTAEADLLLSSLCHDIGDGLYEITPNIRNIFLQRLVNEYSQERIRDIATLLWQYNEHYTPWTDRPELERAQQLTVLNFLDPLKAKQWLAEAEVSLDVAPSVEREWFVAMRKEITRIDDNLSSSQSSSSLYFYDRGLKRLLDLVDREQEEYNNALILQSRLLENLRHEQLYGQAENLRVDRAKLLYQLNKLAQRATGTSFNNLCQVEIPTLSSQLTSIEEEQTAISSTYNFGELLRQFRVHQGMSQQTLAENLGVHRGTIGAWERGAYLPKDRSKVLELAKVLRLNEETSWLLHASLFLVEMQDDHIHLDDDLQKTTKRLSDLQRNQLANALLNAYTEQDLVSMLSFSFHKGLSSVASGSTFAEIIFNLISTVEAEGWIEQLIVAAYDFKSTNEILRDFYQEYISGQIAKQKTQNINEDREPVETVETTSAEARAFYEFSEKTINKAFVSYSHKDRKYLERLQIHIKGYKYVYGAEANLDVWDDTQIQKGTHWQEEIKRAIESAKVAVLLVSADFLASDFIRDREFPALLEATRKGNLTILPIIVGPCPFERTPLFPYVVHSDLQPLTSLPPDAQEEIWAEVADKVCKILNM